MRTKEANNSLLKKVQSDYNQIAESFSETRNKSWPEFELLFKKSQKHSNRHIPYTIYHILDLACGNGRLYDFLSSKAPLTKGVGGFSYTGIDNSEQLLNQAKKLHKKIPYTIYHIPYTFSHGDILSIPAKDNSFDQIWCIAAFHHLPKKYQLQGAKEIHRVLKSDSLIVLTVWQLWQWKYIKEIIKAFLRNPLRIKNLFIPWRKGEKKVDRFYYAFTATELEKIFKKAGFEILDIFTVIKNQKTKTFLKGKNICLIGKKKK